MQYRGATRVDAEGIAQLHADSWRRTYRGDFLDSFLDGDLVTERLAELPLRVGEARGAWAEANRKLPSRSSGGREPSRPLMRVGKGACHWTTVYCMLRSRP